MSSSARHVQYASSTIQLADRLINLSCSALANPTYVVGSTIIVLNKFVVSSLSLSLTASPPVSSHAMASLLSVIFVFYHYCMLAQCTISCIQWRRKALCTQCCWRLLFARNTARMFWTSQSQKQKKNTRKKFHCELTHTAFAVYVRSCRMESTRIQLFQWIFAVAAYRHTVHATTTCVCALFLTANTFSICRVCTRERSKSDYIFTKSNSYAHNGKVKGYAPV